MNTVSYPNTAKTGAAQTVSDLLARMPIQAEGRDLAVINHYKDVAGNVIERLAVLNQMFEFYQYTHDMANFRPETISGLCIVIDDCIDALKTIA